MNQKEAEQFYGTSYAELVERWDAGRSIWTLEMGGMGPGYEQAIQVAMVEILRTYVDKILPSVEDADRELDDVLCRIDSSGTLGGLSEAQAGSAKRIAWEFLTKPPWKAVADWKAKGFEARLIQVSSFWPRVEKVSNEKGE
jgi:hypothetical protein